ncbi:MAG TPA: dienelactone hydrolase family protein [Caulobacteraceae bacterium]|jgi:carboxymethylenebutenolidase
MKGQEFTPKSRADGFRFGAYHVDAQAPRRGGLVLIQEIFGVNANMRALADSFADDGFEVIAPSLFDRIVPGFEAGYGPEGVGRGRSLAEQTEWRTVAGDVQACIDQLPQPVFAAGFCWGGSATWVAAARCGGLAAAAAFYGRLIPDLLDEEPRCPIILHFGTRDESIPAEAVEKVRSAKPDVPIHMYDAAHGFFSDRPDHDPQAAAQARRSTLEFFAQHGG